MRLLALFFLAMSLLVSVALAGKLPGEGVWIYDNGDTVTAKDGRAIFRAYVRVEAKGTSIFSVDGILFGGKCRKGGRSNPAGSMAYDLASKPEIRVHPDGSFSATRKAVGDATGVKGKVKVKGVFNGTRVSGRVTVHLHNPNFGDCRGRGKFAGAKGELAG